MSQLHSVDLFAGCGGLSLGLHEAGFKTLLYCELNDSAAATFEANLGTPDLIRCRDIDELTPRRLGQLKEAWSRQGKKVDLVTGGPPCQGYSAIGHRRSQKVEREEIPSNYLFLRMVEVIEALQPKLFLFENVRGLLAGRWRSGGRKGVIWEEVRAKFQSISGYDIGWKLVHAKDYGVPQNRPRILLVGARRELELCLGENREDDRIENPRGLIPEGKWSAPNLIDVLGDLVDPDYLGKSATTKYPRAPGRRMPPRLRVDREERIPPIGASVTEQEYSRHSGPVRRKFIHMLRTGGKIPASMRTKKFAQRVLPKRWGSSGPTITVTSLPDDFVHFSQPRILTVREWARLQTFPDWYQFKGPRTTGGHRRAGLPSEGKWEREVPKYTQIGNAVPVRLAFAVGLHLAELLRNAKGSAK